MDNEHLESGAHRILVIRLAALGDILLTTPLLHALRAGVPGAHIAYLTAMPAGRDLLDNNPDVDECLLSRAQVLDDIATMPPFSMVLDLFGNRATQWVSVLSGAACRVGAAATDLTDGREPYNILVPTTPRPAHVLDQFARFARAVNLPDPLPRTVLRLRDDEREIARALLATYGISPGERWLGLQPGRRDPEATRSAESFVEVSQELRRELGCPVLVFRGPDDRTSIATDIAHRLGASVLPLLPVRHYAAVLEACALFLASEGGAVHIAAALGTRTLVLRGSAADDYWLPYPRTSGVIALSAGATVSDSVAAAWALWNSADIRA